MMYPILAHFPPDYWFCFSQTEPKEALAPNIDLHIQKREGIQRSRLKNKICIYHLYAATCECNSNDKRSYRF